jgi:riboflavin kinase/FMN adenylyltransferase
MQYIGQSISIRRLMVGKGFALGRGRTGTTEVLASIGEDMDYQLIEIEPFLWNGSIVSSSIIRSLLVEGKLSPANAMLGRPYSVRGTIHHGDGRGHTIGFPTANISLPPKRLLPRSGVYACRVDWEGREIPAVSNIGIRPTFETGETLAALEAHLLDFKGDLYNKLLHVHFIERLRDEKKFASVQDLIHQIEADVRSAREILS